jgi:hypothetical protein
MRFPSIRAVAAELVAINRAHGALKDDGNGNLIPSEDATDVRLQVYSDGTWAVRWGSPDFDQDHRGYWGAASVPGHKRRFRSADVARDLIRQARDQWDAADESGRA